MTAHSFSSPFARPFNPFLPTEDAIEEIDVADATDGGEVSYALVQSGPAVSSEETESHLDAVEVKISWGTQILSTTHLEQGKGFSIGDGGDFVHPNAFGKTNLVSTRGMSTVVSIPEGATATLFARGESPRSVNAGDEIELMAGMRLSIELDPVTIEVSAVRAGKKFKVGFLASLAGGAAAAIGLSFVGHAAIVASLAMFMPKMNADDAEAIDREQVLKMQALLDASADREQEMMKDEQASADATGGGAKGGEPHKGEEGKAGSDQPKAPSGHMALRGDDNKVVLSRADELRMAREGGFIGILSSGMITNGPNSPWGADWQQGMDSEDHKGGLFGESMGDERGSGLGLSGTGIGGGGHGEGVGIDGVGNTVGGGGGGPGKWGYGKGDKGGIGNGHGPGGGGHQVKTPTMRPDPNVQVNGHLPPEVIQRIVRQNAGRMKMCYETGLRTNPTLNGRVTTKFVIGRDGSVSVAQDAGSDMPDQQVVSCVVRSFQNLSFPQPEGGVATVVYPIVFTPGE
jgi:hypothetical protein